MPPVNTMAVQWGIATKYEAMYLAIDSKIYLLPAEHADHLYDKVFQAVAYHLSSQTGK